jgi:hypothetical protein
MFMGIRLGKSMSSFNIKYLIKKYNTMNYHIIWIILRWFILIRILEDP